MFIGFYMRGIPRADDLRLDVVRSSSSLEQDGITHSIVANSNIMENTFFMIFAEGNLVLVLQNYIEKAQPI